MQFNQLMFRLHYVHEVVQRLGDTLREWKNSRTESKVPTIIISEAAKHPNVYFYKWKAHKDWVTEVSKIKISTQGFTSIFASSCFILMIQVKCFFHESTNGFILAELKNEVHGVEILILST